ncbi:MAG: acetyl esterase [Pseudonocardiales bacterium]|nr:acetyl esterase [Pseudonocardiales bacterium]
MTDTVPAQTQAALDLMQLSPARYVGQRDVTRIRAELHEGALAIRPPGPRPDGVTFADHLIEGALPVRVYRPAALAGPPILFLHGGGWAICDVETHHELACQLAADTGRLVASVEYRLAPEHPYPAPLDDTRTAARWLASQPGADAGIVVAGDSSGGNLAAALALASAQDPSLPRVVLQVLLYPVLDDDLTSDTYQAFAGGRFGLSEEQMRWYWQCYAPAAGTRRDPLAVPARAASLDGVAPAFIAVGEFDPLLSEARAYAAALRAAGVPTTLREYRGGFHGFYSFRGVLDIAADAAADVATAITSA